MDSKGPPQAPQDEFTQDLTVFMPGADVVVSDGTRRAKIRVFPASFKNMRDFARHIGNALQSVAGLQIKKGADGTISPEQIGVLIPIFVDIIITDLIDLVMACTRPSAAGLPHWMTPPIIEEWLRQNFGSEEKIRPWVQAVETLISKTLGQSVSLWETFSHLYSPAAITEAISSSLRERTSKGETSLTPAGASPSSGSGQSEQQTSSTTSEPTDSKTQG